MMNRLSCCLALPVLCLAVFSARADEEEDFNAAKELTSYAMKDGRWQKAEAAWKTYRTQWPDAPGAIKAHLYLAIAAYSKKHWSVAYAEAEAVAENSQRTPADERQLLYWAGRARLEDARSLFLANKHDEARKQARIAERHFRKLKQHFPDKDESREASIHLAVVFDITNRPAETVSELQGWLAKNESHPRAGDAFYLLGRNLLRTDKNKDGDEVLSRYLRKEPRGPHAPDAHFLCGIAAFRDNNYAAAQTHFDEAIQADHPLKHQVYLEKARCFQAIKQFASAAEMYGLASKSSNRAFAHTARYWQGCAYSELSDRKKSAIDCLEDAARGELEAALAEDCRFRLACLYYQDRRFETCRSHAEAFVGAYSTSGYCEQVLQLQAESAEQLKDWKEARSIWEKIAARKTKIRPQMLVRAAGAARRSKDDDGAIALLNTVLKEAPGSAAAARAELALGHIYIGQNKIDAAAVSFERALRLHQGGAIEAEAGYWLGECHLRRHRHADAIRLFETVTRESANRPEAPFACLKAATAYDLEGKKAEADRCYRLICARYPNHEVASTARRRLEPAQR